MDERDETSTEDGSASTEDGSGLTPVQHWHYYTRYPYLLAKIAFFAAIFYAIYWSLQNVANVIFPLLTSLLIAYLLDPAVDWFEERGVSRTVAIILFLVIGLLGIALFSLVLYPTITSQVSKVAERLPQLVELVQTEAVPWVEKTFDYEVPPTFSGAMDKYGTTVKEQLPNIAEKAGDWLGGLATKTGAVAVSLLNLIMIPIFVFYFLRDFDRMRLATVEFVPKGRRDFILERVRLADDVVGAWFRGQLQVAGILAVLYSIGLATIFGMIGVGVIPGIAIGLLTGFLNVVPYLGVLIGVVLSGLIVLINFSGWGGIVGVAGVFTVVQLLEGYIITPKIVGEKVGLSPVVVIIVLLLGGEVFGLIGVLLAIPVAGIVRVLLPDFIDRYKRSPFYTGDFEPYGGSEDVEDVEDIEGDQDVEDVEDDEDVEDVEDDEDVEDEGAPKAADGTNAEAEEAGDTPVEDDDISDDDQTPSGRD